MAHSTLKLETRIPDDAVLSSPVYVHFQGTKPQYKVNILQVDRPVPIPRDPKDHLGRGYAQMQILPHLDTTTMKPVGSFEDDYY